LLIPLLVGRNIGLIVEAQSSKSGILKVIFPELGTQHVTQGNFGNY
jgi:hypothetical protein